MCKFKLIFIALILSGCASQAQVIKLTQQPSVSMQAIISDQPALVKVVDHRSLSSHTLGYRSNKPRKSSAVNIKQSLAKILTTRLQESLTQLGFGGDDHANALRLQLTIDEFRYQCKQSLMSECTINMSFLIEVMDDYSSFKKPYSFSEKRTLVAPPVQEYNQQWINDALERFWRNIFNDKQLLRRLARGSQQVI